MSKIVRRSKLFIFGITTCQEEKLCIKTYKPTHKKIDLVSHPTCAEGFVEISVIKNQSNTL